MLTLPPELLNAIVDELSARDKKNLRSTNKLFDLVVGPSLFSTLVVDVKERGLFASVSCLKVFSEEGCEVTSYVKNLVIRSLGPTFDFPFVRGADGITWITTPSSKEVDEKALAFDNMKELLPRVLSSFVNLASVEWTIPHYDPEWAHALVINTIATLPLLSNLSLEFVWNYHKPHASPLNLSPFHNLKSFSLKGSFRDLEENVLRPIRGLLKNNADLSTLSLDFTKSSSSTEADLDQFITSWSPKVLAKANLKHLRLGLFQGTLTPSSLSHLRSLSSLELLDARMVVSANIWDALHQEKIHLREIVVPAVNDSFLRYIGSYSGIRKLHYHSVGAPIERADSTLADMFYEQVLPRHTDTLEDLAIHPRFEGRWSFGERNAKVLRQCTVLMSLGVSLDRVHGGSLNVASALNCALSHPHLQQLYLRCTLFVGPRPTKRKPTVLSSALIFSLTKDIEQAVLSFTTQAESNRMLEVVAHDSNYEKIYETRVEHGVLGFVAVDA
ncbi:hypothetical protein Moror_11439 [Moniliophthora roreri MCA 2997]|uniref:F-box domain-containing protein n=1 Tax=Moniliophthora roreri (strain MCA 2997) TaxID=1381753 RepID=V2WR89_MONRO|nr:hypothetical protein Moror_11439 [Moniliophthora roreri MCA 2997]